MSSNNSGEKERPQEGKRVGKSGLLTLPLVLMLLAGLAIMLYPAVSDMWNSRVQSHAIENYQGSLSQMAQGDDAALFAEAERYNAALCGIDLPLVYCDTLREREDLLPYEDILDVDGSGMIGYVTVDRIGVRLPFYHGTSESVLNSAVGHLEGTSLPVGGAGTHCVLSAHRGLPGATLFSDLDKLQEGDVFTVSVLERVLVYQVCEVSVVEPSEVESFCVTEGEDLCTLLTCTPYGINTHRLLVTGRRIEQPPTSASDQLHDTASALPSRQTVILIIAVPLLVLLTLFIILRPNKRSGKGKKHE